MASPDMNRVAVLQMVSTDRIDANLAEAGRLLAEAAAAGARLAVLPENFALLDAGRLRATAETEWDVLCDWVAAAAVRHGLWIVAGTLPAARRPDGSPVAERVRAASLVFDDQGQLRARYDKLHMFDVDVADAQGQYRESSYLEPGDRLVVVDTPVGRLGLSVCYDLRFPELYRRLTEAGAELVAVPSAFTYVTGEAHWQTLLQARAIENQLYVLGANQGGVHSPRRQTWGHSQIIDPWGSVLASWSTGPGLALAALDPQQLAERRARMPVLQHRREDLASLPVVGGG